MQWTSLSLLALCLGHAAAVQVSEGGVVHLFANGSAEMDKAFSDAFASFEKSFDYKLYDKFVAQFKETAGDPLFFSARDFLLGCDQEVSELSSFFVA